MKITFNLRKFLVSPMGATIFPLFLLIIAFFLPPSIYSKYIKEVDYMFLNMKMLIFVLLCHAFYYIGIFTNRFKFILKTKIYIKKIKVSKDIFIGFLAILTILMNIIFLVVFSICFYKVSGVGMLEMILNGQADLIKSLINSEKLIIPFGLGAIPTFLIAIELWLLYKLYELPIGNYKLLKFFIYISVTLFIIIAIITVNRSVLMIPIIGWFVIYLHLRKTKISFSFFLKFFLIISVLFAITSVIRWNADVQLIIERLIGYTIANFNRMVLMIDGKLSYVKAGVPNIFYLIPIIKIPFTSVDFFNFREISQISFLSIGDVGLNPAYNMATLYGGIYQVIGIATLLYFFFLGIIGSYLYYLFVKQKYFGILMYPLFYAFVALWMIDVNIFMMFFLYFFYAYIIILIYSSLFKTNDLIKT